MKLFLNYLLPIFVAVSLTAQESDQNNEKERLLKFSEAFGNFIGRNLKNPGIDFDLESVIKGIRDGAKGLPSPLSDEEYERMMLEYQAKSFKATADRNLAEAEDFLRENSSKEDVIEVVPNKLQYRIIQQGEGEEVKEGFSPLINFEGHYIDGTVFGSSKEGGGPVTIDLEQTIPGFKKGIIGMKKGEKRTLFIHPELGFGQAGNIPPNSLLIFDIEVVETNSKKEQGDADQNK